MVPELGQASFVEEAAATNSIRDDGDDDDARDRRFVFSIIDGTPSSARLIPLPPGTARRLSPDDIQIVAHADFSKNEEGGRIGVGAAAVATNPVLVLSRLGRHLSENPTILETWRVEGQTRFTFRRLHLSDAEVDLISRLVVSGANHLTENTFDTLQEHDEKILSRLAGSAREKPTNANKG